MKKILDEILLSREKLDNINNNIDLLNNEKSLLKNNINDLYMKLQDKCTHDCNFIENTEYIEGSYLDKSEYHTTIHCSICKKLIEKKNNIWLLLLIYFK